MKIKYFANNPFQENTYIVWDEHSHDGAMVDCGVLFNAEQEAVAQYIADNGIRITHLLNTHLHLDHCFGNHWAAECYCIKPEAHEADAPYIANFNAQLRSFGLDPDIAPAEPIGAFLRDGDVVAVGNLAFEVIHTPGHTPGGVCYYCKTEKIVLTGDTLFAGSVGRADLEGGSYSDLIRSIKNKLMSLPDDVRVYCGHGPYTTIGDERRNNPFL